MKLRRALQWVVVLAVSACSPAFGASKPAEGKAIERVDQAAFAFGSMAIGQAKDLDHARAEGLGLVPATPLDAYLNGILVRLLEHSPVSGVPARVYVRASNEWAAKSTADANVYVSLGILLRLDSEDEVAALLAHEASHVILGHANSDVVQNIQQRAIQLSSLAIDAQRAVAEARGKRPGADAASVRTDEQSRALLLNATLLSPSWTRGQERNADRLGTDLMVRAGYSPEGMASLLEKQQKFEAERAADPQAVSLDQQLLGYDVVEKGNQQVAKATAQQGATGELIGALAGAVLARSRDAVAKRLDEGSRSHPRTGERIGDIRAYIAQEYGGADPPSPRIEPWEAAKEADGTVDMLENYIASIEARSALSSGNVASARTLAKAGLSGPTGAHAYPRYVDAAVQTAAGEPAQALADYEAALAGPEPAGAIYSAASALLLAAGQRERAVDVMEGGYRRLQEAPSLTVPLIHAYRLAGRQGDADRLAAECALRWPTMQQVCKDEAAGRAEVRP
jgi:predicted Zn-dependent protease